MLSPAMNERLTHVGPGTPGGELMRRHWIPTAAYSQLDHKPHPANSVSTTALLPLEGPENEI